MNDKYLHKRASLQMLKTVEGKQTKKNKYVFRKKKNAKMKYI